MSVDNIENHLGLHKTLEVHYYVDYYEARLVTDTAERVIARGSGESVDYALQDLDNLLSHIEVKKHG